MQSLLAEVQDFARALAERKKPGDQSPFAGNEGARTTELWAKLRDARERVEKILTDNPGLKPANLRAAGITNHLENDGTLEVAQRIAGHADSRTTKLYDRRGQKVLLEDMERIRY